MILSISMIHVGRNKLIDTRSVVPHIHRPGQGCSTMQQPIQPKGDDPAAAQPVGPRILMEMAWEILWLSSDACGAEQCLGSLASASCIQQIYNSSCITNVCSQTRSSCLVCVCRDKTIHGLSSAFWKPLCMNDLFAFLKTSLVDTKKQEKLHPRCFSLWFDCVFLEYLAFIMLPGLLQIV